jgi:hypothetical protein
MRLLTLAAGLAVGYLLGTRAGREKYEQIVDTTRQLREHPTVVRAQQKVSSAVAPTGPASPSDEPVTDSDGVAGSTHKPAPRRRTTAATTESDPSV